MKLKKLKDHIIQKVLSIGLKYKSVINRSPLLRSLGKRIYYRFTFGSKSVSKPLTLNTYNASGEYYILSHSAKQIFETLKEEMKHNKVNNSSQKNP